MPDLTITDADVRPDADADYYQGIAGESITPGMPCYQDSLTHRLYATDADASLDAADVKGLSLNSADANQPLRLQTDGTIFIGATTVEGTIYVCSANPGGIAPAADLAAGDYTSIVGVGGPENTIRLSLFPSHSLIPGP